MLGNGRIQVFCFDGKQRVCHIRGKLRKKVWINQGDIILVGLRDYQDEKGDVISKYTLDEARRIKNSGLIPENAQLNENENKEEEGEIEFSDLLVEKAEEEGAKSSSESTCSSNESTSDADSTSSDDF